MLADKGNGIAGVLQRVAFAGESGQRVSQRQDGINQRVDDERVFRGKGERHRGALGEDYADRFSGSGHYLGIAIAGHSIADRREAGGDIRTANLRLEISFGDPGLRDCVQSAGGINRHVGVFGHFNYIETVLGAAGHPDERGIPRVDGHASDEGGTVRAPAFRLGDDCKVDFLRELHRVPGSDRKESRARGDRFSRCGVPDGERSGSTGAGSDTDAAAAGRQPRRVDAAHGGSRGRQLGERAPDQFLIQLCHYVAGTGPGFFGGGGGTGIEERDRSIAVAGSHENPAVRYCERQGFRFHGGAGAPHGGPSQNTEIGTGTEPGDHHRLFLRVFRGFEEIQIAAGYRQIRDRRIVLRKHPPAAQLEIAGTQTHQIGKGSGGVLRRVIVQIIYRANHRIGHFVGQQAAWLPIGIKRVESQDFRTGAKSVLDINQPCRFQVSVSRLPRPLPFQVGHHPSAGIAMQEFHAVESGGQIDIGSVLSRVANGFGRRIKDASAINRHPQATGDGLK